MMPGRPILCVDFDGVIHLYSSPWIDEFTISDGQVPGALQWLNKAREWFEIHIYSARSATPAGRAAMRAWLYTQARNEWPDDAAKPFELLHDITFAHKKPPAFLTIDDRAITFTGEWGNLDPELLRQFKPWNKRGI
jgi:hypothetical protein